jgi:hypothetical protein
MDKLMLDIFYHPNFLNQGKSFCQRYDLVGITASGDTTYSKRSLKKHSERICRFCARRYPATSFSNYSHLLPQLMGNKDLYSNFECDECNDKFSIYENDLSEFLGISRSFTGFNGSGKGPSFVARKLRAKSRSFIGENILIVAPEDIKRRGDKTVISYTKNPFIPANVYKALLKSSLSLLGDSQIKENYRDAIDFLSCKKTILERAIISGYNLTFKLNLPLHIYFFQKKKNDDHIPTHVIIFNFQNRIIAFPIPFHQKDIAFNSRDFNILIPPPYFVNESAMTSSMPTPFIMDLCSTEKIEDETEYITLKLDSESLKNTVKYNPEKDEYQKTEYDEEEIKYLILTKGDVTINHKVLSIFIKEQMEGIK